MRDALAQPNQLKGKGNSMNLVAKLIGGAICASVILAGCSAGNAGGDTSCGDFNKLDSKKQTDVITKMLKDEHGKEPSNLEVAGTRLSAAAFCKTLGKDSSKVRDIKTG